MSTKNVNNKTDIEKNSSKERIRLFLKDFVAEVVYFMIYD